MITDKDLAKVLEGYDLENLTIGVLGGHSALDVCKGAKELGFRTLAVCQKGREQTYAKYYKTRKDRFGEEIGCIDEIVLVDKFGDIVKPEVQEELRKHNTIFIHNRYFWVYCDFAAVENDFMVPIFGNRELVKLEERDHPNNQYVLLEKAGIRIPKIVRPGDSGFDEVKTRSVLDEHFADSNIPLIVKVNEAERSYERAFFIVTSVEQYFEVSEEMIAKGKILKKDLDNSVIEEFILGAQVNFNFFYSPLSEDSYIDISNASEEAKGSNGLKTSEVKTSGRLELMGTDTRRQTSLDGFLRLDAETQMSLLKSGVKPSMIETGHIACTVKESLLEKAFAAGEKFVKTLEEESKKEGSGVNKGMIGPFALQGAIASFDGKEELVVFDVSMRIPGSPGTAFTPYSGYLYGDPLSFGERIALEIQDAVEKEKENPGELLKILS